MENIYNVQRVKARINILDGGNEGIDVMFNPTEYSVNTLGTLDRTNPKDPFFSETRIEDFTVRLIFDTYEKHDSYESGTDVRKTTEKITRLIMPTEEGTERKKPPVCVFTWGNFSFKGIVTRINQRFILFLPDGTPVREEMMVVFTSVMTDKEYEKFMGLEACRKTWTVKSGDRLDLIADRELKDGSLWRRIAEENHIYDPFNFPAKDDIGRRIIIPD